MLFLDDDAEVGDEIGALVGHHQAVGAVVTCGRVRFEGEQPTRRQARATAIRSTNLFYYFLKSGPYGTLQHYAASVDSTSARAPRCPLARRKGTSRRKRKQCMALALAHCAGCFRQRGRFGTCSQWSCGGHSGWWSQQSRTTEICGVSEHADCKG